MAQNESGEKKKRGAPAGVERKADTRPSTVIFQDKVNKRLNQIARMLERLAKIGRARKARPTQAQFEAAKSFLEKKVQEALIGLSYRLRESETEAAKAEDLQIIPPQ